MTTSGRMKYTVSILVVYLLLGWGFAGCRGKTVPANVRNDFTDLSVVENAFTNRQSNIQVTQQGEIIWILADDTSGSQHQRCIVKLSSGQTLLIAHNIDIAPRVPALRTGEPLIFHGEYEWNDQGGVIHWTHHDPDGRHEDGWLEYHGKIYQ
jgi:hypothetical protein